MNTPNLATVSPEASPNTLIPTELVGNLSFDKPTGVVTFVRHKKVSAVNQEGGGQETLELSSETLEAYLEESFSECENKDAVFLWSAAEFIDMSGPRAVSNVSQVHALILDFDKSTEAQVKAKLEELRSLGLAYVTYTSFRRSAEIYKCRLVLFLSEPVAALDWKHLWWVIVRALGMADMVDRSCSHAASVFYLPSGDPTKFEIKRASGGAIDVQWALSQEMPSEARQEDSEESSEPPEGWNPSPRCISMYENKLEKWALAALEGFAASDSWYRWVNDWLYKLAQSCPTEDLAAHLKEVAHAAVGRCDEEWASKNKRTKPPNYAQDEASKAIADGLRKRTWKKPLLDGFISKAKDNGTWLEKDEIEFTELGLSRRFSATHSGQVRHVSGYGWIYWVGTHWRPSRHRPVQLIGDMLHEIAASLPADKEDLKGKLHIMRSNGKLNAIALLAETDPRLSGDFAELDSHPYLLNVRNGTIDLRTGNLQAHDPSDKITKIIKINYDPGAVAPRWVEAQTLYMANDTVAVDCLQRVLGAMLHGEVLNEEFYIMLGNGLNGKSVVIETMVKILGPYAGAITENMILETKYETHTSAWGGMAGTRFAYLEELKERARLDMDKIKRNTGKNPIRCQPGMGQDFVYVTPSWKLILPMNHEPTISDISDGSLRRIRVIPFTVKLKDQGIVPNLRFAKELVQAEGVGILSWLVAGCVKALAGESLTCPKFQAATDALNAGNDLIQPWLDTCVLEKDARTCFDDLYKSYLGYCFEHKDKPLSKKTFAGKLDSKGFGKCSEGKHNVATRIGLRLKDAK